MVGVKFGFFVVIRTSRSRGPLRVAATLVAAFPSSLGPVLDRQLKWIEDGIVVRGGYGGLIARAFESSDWR